MGLRARSCKAGLVGATADGGVPVGAVEDPESDFLNFGGVDPETDFSMGKESCASGDRSVIGSTAGES